MGKNLCGRGAIDPETLRQRRDFYSVSIGLVIFYFAGGSINQDSTLGMLPLHFENPHVFLIAAWIGWGYFLWRYWLHTENIFSDFKEEMDWQATDTWFARRLINTIAKPVNEQQKNYLQMCNQKKPLLCKLNKVNGKARIELVSLSINKVSGPGYLSIDQHRWELEKSEILYYYSAKAFGFFKALYKEKTFTNYILPYLIGLITVVVYILKKTNLIHFLERAFIEMQIALT